METETQAGPPSPTFLTLVLKTFAGLGGGIIGMIILLLIFLGSSAILEPVLHPEQLGLQGGAPPQQNPVFIFIIMAMIFLTSLGANLLGSIFFTFVEHERYSRVSTAMYQIFSLNIVIFIILAPIYILLNARGLLGLTGFLAEFHVLVSALASVMVLEIIGNLRYALVGVYGVIFSLISSAGFLVLLYGFSKGDPTLVLFATLPVIWTSLGFVTVIAEMLYRWLWTLYGTDFLMSKTDFGVDYEGTAEEEAPPKPDVTGAEFLKK